MIATLMLALASASSEEIKTSRGGVRLGVSALNFKLIQPPMPMDLTIEELKKEPRVGESAYYTAKIEGVRVTGLSQIQYPENFPKLATEDWKAFN